jgi:hypothetical protein
MGVPDWCPMKNPEAIEPEYWNRRVKDNGKD